MKCSQNIRKGVLLASLYCTISLYAQSTTIQGLIWDSYTGEPLSGVTVQIVDEDLKVNTDQLGGFEINSGTSGSKLISFSKEGYNRLDMEVYLEGLRIDLGVIYLESGQQQIQDNGTVSLAELDIDEELIPNSGLLAASRDILATRAAFDFGQVFYRIRGYDSRNGIVLLNGIPMNRMSNGRAQWSNWGGLNDVLRNQEYHLGQKASNLSFGDILGLTYINTRPALMRPGLRITSSFSNRTYQTRLMATYNKAGEAPGWAYSISASRRWGNSGIIQGTPYDAHSIFGSLEYQFNTSQGIFLTAFLASNRRGRNSAVTAEVQNLVGNRYNPNWGFHRSEVRHSKVRDIQEPVVMLNYYYNTRKLSIEAGVSYQWGKQSNSRLGYYNAPNPNPDYYQYLPSYFVNSSIGANFTSAEMARHAFIGDPQLKWSSFYQANQAISSEGRASYILYDDVVDENSIRVHAHGNIRIAPYSYIDLGLNYTNTTSDNYAQVGDLLGAQFHLDIDPFSETYNDLNSSPQKKENELFNYHYGVKHHMLDAFAQWRFVFGRFNGFFAAKFYHCAYQREGYFDNERYPDNSLGTSEQASFSNNGFKGGVSYEFNKRHRLEANGVHSFRPPFLENVFINPRENNEIIEDIQDEKIISVDASYKFDLPTFSGRLTAYYTKFLQASDVNYFFINSGVGSDFVQEVITGLDRLHTGLELGVIYKPTSSVSISAVASVSKFLYASDPNIQINFDTAGPDEDLINIEGREDLGKAALEGKQYAAGPAQAISLGVEYRDPDYWRLGITLNRLAENYIRISPISRTESFKLDPETGDPFPEATPENLGSLLEQKPLPEVYLLNLTFGKSWLWKKKYISFFASVSNLMDVQFISGGYEQSRNGNYGQAYRDNLSGSSSFGPKYWYGYGRTYFLNLAISL